MKIKKLIEKLTTYAKTNEDYDVVIGEDEDGWWGIGDLRVVDAEDGFNLISIDIEG